MMFFPTKAKVQRELDLLLTRLEQIDKRLQRYEAQQRIVGSIFGPALELDEMRAAREDIYLTIIEAHAGVRFGTVSFREVAPQLKPVSAAIRHFEKVLDQTDAASAAGQAAFKTRYST
jgi:hypothetical protein